MSNTPKEARIADKMEQIKRATSRRSFLRATAATGILAGLGMSASAQAQTYRLGGNTAAWEGRAPPEIEGQENPTLRLEPGRDYVVVWENVDGQPHNFAILDDTGNPLVRTEIISERGATQRVEFTAEEQMAEYYCEVHPASMRGRVQTGGGAATTEGTETAGEAPRFFERGTEVGVQQVAGGMTAPTDFAVANGDDRRFVADQTGQVWVIGPDGDRQDQPFIDVQDRMVTLGEFAGDYADQEQAYDERGLLGIEFHPDFGNNRKFYLHYSAPRREDMPDNWDHVEVVSEFTASDDGSTGNAGSERRLLQIESPQYNHDAGPLAFGPDGYLYVPMGDGGGANDDMYGHVDDWYDRNAGGNGQDVEENLLGSILRIDVDSQEANRPYGIPDDNPLAGQNTPGLDEIYAWGFRNPFGISFDSEGTLFVSDAGQNLFEEANIVERGGNYGWNVKEGTHCFSTENAAEPPQQCPTSTPDDVRGGEPLVDPIVEYPHTYEGQSVGITIIGGHRYENDAVSGLQGKYVFGDWTKDPAREQPAGRILAATPPGGGAGTETTQAGTETAEAGIETEEGTTEAAAMGAGAQETTGATETTQAGTTQAGGDTPTDVPRGELWQMEELVVAGSDDGTLDHFVRQFGRDGEGELYVLANKRGVPLGNTGVLLKVVPPEEGDLSGTSTETGTTRTGTAESGTTAAGETVTETGEPGDTTQG